MFRIRISENGFVRTTSSDGIRITEGSSSPGCASISARVNICNPRNEFISSRVFISGTGSLSARVFIQYKSDDQIQGSVNICSWTSSDIFARVYIPATSPIPAAVNIYRPGEISGSVNIFNVYRSGFISARVNICDYFDADISGKVNISNYCSGTIGAAVYIIPSEEIDAKVTIYTKQHYGFIDEFTRTMNASVFIFGIQHSYIGASCFCIADKPNTPTISCNVPEGMWQEEQDIIFTWTAVTARFVGIGGYYVMFNHSPDTQASLSFSRIEDFNMEYDLEQLDGAGVYYFHVAARGTNGQFSDTAHYAIFYNHKPPAPTRPMTVNGLECTSRFRTIPRSSIFSVGWGRSYDSDIHDSISYDLEFSKYEDFGLDNTHESPILYSLSGISASNTTIQSASLSATGELFWRVRAFDGHEYSKWSPTGRLKVNTPPPAPKNLEVYV